jgi:hypothetical protein
MDKDRKVQNILIVITAIIIAIFIAQVTFNILDNKGVSLMQIPNGKLKCFSLSRISSYLIC